MFNAPDQDFARIRVQRIIDEWSDTHPKLARWLEESISDTLAVFALPAKLRKRLRTTNGLERYHQEGRRRSRVVRIFPNRASCLRLSAALMMEQTEEWLTGHRYLDMQALEEVSELTTTTTATMTELEDLELDLALA